MRSFLGIDLEYVDITLDTVLPELQKVKSQHLTLYFWNDLTENDAMNLSKQLQLYTHTSFDISATRIYAFPNNDCPDVLALQFDSLGSLTHLRNEVLSYFNLPLDGAFEPHITLYRKQKLDSSFKQSKVLLQQIPPIKIKINNLALYSSSPETGLNEYQLLSKKMFD